MEASAEAMEFPERKELATINKKNARREHSIEDLRIEIIAEDKSRIPIDNNQEC